MSYLKSAGAAVIYIAIFLAVITFMPGLPPRAKFSEYNITPPQVLEGELAFNERLNNAEILYLGELKGPESFESYNGELYTGVHGGYIVKLKENEIVPVAKLGEDCSGIWQEHKCGKVLGLKFDKKGVLYAVDTYHGIFKIEKTGKYELLINTSEPIDGKVPHVPNSLDIAANGDIYWTDSSVEFPLYDGAYIALADPSGRLIRYDAAMKKNEVLLENLAFANGVKLSDDESFLIIAETQASRIIKYNLKGSKAGQSEIFADGLPGMPDNIHSDGRNGFLVSFYFYVDSQNPQLTQTLASHPDLRKMLARLLALMEAPFKLIQQIYPNDYVERLIHSIGSLEPLKVLGPSKALIIQLDATGKIIDAAYATDEKVALISSAYVHNDYLWLGSPFNEYIARVPLKKALPNYAKHPVNIVTEKQSTKSNVGKQTMTSTPQNAKADPKVILGSSDNKKVKLSAQTTTPRPVKVETPKPEAQKSQEKVSAAPTKSDTSATKDVPVKDRKPGSTTTTPKPTVSQNSKLHSKPSVKSNPTQSPRYTNTESSASKTGSKETNQNAESITKHKVPKSTTASDEKVKDSTRAKASDTVDKNKDNDRKEDIVNQKSLP